MVADLLMVDNISYQITKPSFNYGSGIGQQFDLIKACFLTVFGRRKSIGNSLLFF